MAEFAACKRSIRALGRHALAELPVVRVGVARGATAIFKMEGHDFVGGVRDAYFVAVAAGNCDMRAGQRELGLSMLRDRKQNAVEILDGVAGVAAVVERGGRELNGGERRVGGARVG